MIQLFHSFEHLLYSVLQFFQSATEPLLGANSYWVAIVLMTVTVRLALLPLVVKQVRSARAMRALQPQFQALRERHGKDQAKLMEETTKLTREHGVNPLAGCLPLPAQMPVFIALSRVIWSPVIDGHPNVLRGHLALGVDLGSNLAAMSWADRLGSPGGLLILALIVVAAITTTLTQRLSFAQQPTPLPDSQRRLLQLMPLLWIRFPLAAIMYWVTSNLWTLGQAWVTSRSNPPLPAAVPAAPSGAAKPAGKPAGNAVAKNGAGAHRARGGAPASGSPAKNK